MSENTALRILTAIAMVGVICIAAIIGPIGIAVLGAVISLLMMYEWFNMSKKFSFAKRALGFVWLVVFLAAVIALSSKGWILLLLFITISATDVGAWFFGKRIDSPKLIPTVSAGKTWGGHICGMICGTIACFLYGSLVMDAVMTQMIWIGISVATLSQYGDLTESYFKRQAGIKDSSGLLPGHGGFLDRFDGWLYALPLTALIAVVI
jgi:phosphatidate cytidylyltransferase